MFCVCEQAECTIKRDDIVLSEQHFNKKRAVCKTACYQTTVYKTYVSTLRTATGAKTLEVATREAPIDLEGALKAVKADAVAATVRTARENFMVY